MTATLLQPQTLQEFLQLAEIDSTPPLEFIAGEIRAKIMGGGQHSRLQKRLVSAIDRSSSAYEAFPELRCNFGDRSVIPDVSILSRDRVPFDETGDIIATGIDFAPNWAIEILSPQQYQTKVTENLLYCLRHGTQLGWLVDPQTRSVLVYQSDRLPDVCSGKTILPVLADLDFSLSVEQLFSWLRRE